MSLYDRNYNSVTELIGHRRLFDHRTASQCDNIKECFPHHRHSINMVFDMANADKHFYAKIRRGVRKGSVGRIVKLHLQISWYTSDKTLRFSKKLQFHAYKIELKLDKTDMLYTINADAAELVGKQKFRHVYKTKEDRAMEADAARMDAIDPFGAELKVGSVVFWSYNEPVRGGSRPHLAIGRIDKINPKTVSMEMLWCKTPQILKERLNKKVRADIGALVLLDEETLERAAIHRLTTI